LLAVHMLNVLRERRTSSTQVGTEIVDIILVRNQDGERPCEGQRSG
jgi:hypothetical protein